MMNMEIDRRTITFSEANTSDLLDRLALNKLRERIIKEIEVSVPGTILCLDLSKIRWINSSGADEVIGKAIRFLKESQQEVFLYIETEVNNYEHIFNIERALYDAELPLMSRVKTGPDSYVVHTVGPLQPYLEKVLRHVYLEKQSVSSADCAEALGLSKHKCSSYLSKLFDLRLLKRMKTTTKVGYEYAYYPLFS